MSDTLFDLGPVARQKRGAPPGLTKSAARARVLALLGMGSKP